jgi:phosphoglycerate kinase
MKTLRDFDIKGKKVLLRVDFNVPLDENGVVLDDFRVKKTLPTIKYLEAGNAKTILISHLGRPEGKRVQKDSLRPVALLLKNLLGKEIKFLDDCRGEKVEREVDKMRNGEIVLLENLRFYKEEEENNEKFAKELARLADIYINDAFAVSHRAHASVFGVPQILPAGAGFLLEDELKNLNKILEDPKRPLVVIIGGAKLETKIKVIERFLVLADHLLLGGKIANVILAGKGLCSAGPLAETELAAKIEKFDLTNPKIHLPLDGKIALNSPPPDGGYVREGAVGTVRADESVFDIGSDTIKIFSHLVKQAGTVFWNGPVGYFEDKRFANGTLELASAIIKSGAFSLVGGGETDEFLEKEGLREKFSYVSTGGGAMLEFMSGDKLPGIEALK